MTTSNQGRFYGNDATARAQVGRIEQLKSDIESLTSVTVKALADAGAANAEIQAVEKHAMELGAAIKKTSDGVAARFTDNKSANKNQTDC